MSTCTCGVDKQRAGRSLTKKGAKIMQKNNMYIKEISIQGREQQLKQNLHHKREQN